MNSEFHNIELDRIRYSIVWEDYQSLYEGLTISSDDALMIITSAGCNVLNALLQNPTHIYAVDINAYQNKLLDFKLNLYKNSNYEIFSILLGLDENSNCLEALHSIKDYFEEKEYEDWKEFFTKHPQGLLCSGQLEKYIHSFLHQLDDKEQELLANVSDSKNIKEQIDKFNKLISDTKFELKFKVHFNNENLSKGRDPKLFKYADEKGDSAFYNRLYNYAQHHLLKHSFYMQFFFYGLKGIKNELLPPCYRKENFDAIKKNSHKISLHTDDAIDFLTLNSSLGITKASLSNIFEYTSTEEFEASIEELKNKSSIKSIVFWNLLHEQAISLPSYHYLDIEKSNKITHNESCFYFKNVRALTIK